MQPHSATLPSPPTLAPRSKLRAVEYARVLRRLPLGMLLTGAGKLFRAFYFCSIRRRLRFAALQLNWGCSGAGHHHGSRTGRRVTHRLQDEPRLTARCDASLRLQAYHFACPTPAISSVPDAANNYDTNTSLETSTACDFSTGSVSAQTDANNKTIIKVEI